jgi:hypothetical protein
MGSSQSQHTLGEEVAGAATTLPLLMLLDLSWNCIANFGVLLEALAFSGSSSMCPSLLELDLKGNSLSDAGCARLCAALRASGATPPLMLEAAQAVVEGGVDGPPSSGNGGKGRLRRYLRLLADGDATNSRVCRLALWDSSTVWDGAKRAWVDKKGGLQTEFCSTDEAGGSAEMRLRFELLWRDRFVVRPPLASAQDMTRLAVIMERLESAGWLPVFCFMSDAVWDFVAAQVWPVVRALLGVDCVLDSGSAFAWLLKTTGKSTFPRDGEFRSWQNAVSSVTLVTGNTGTVTFWEVQHAAMPAKRHAYHATPSGRYSALMVTVPPMQNALPTTPCLLVGMAP